MMQSTSVAPTPINTFFQVFIAKVSRLSAYDRSCRVLVIERRKRTVVAHEQLRSDERESSLVRAKQVSPCAAPVGLRRETRGAIDYIVASVRLVGSQRESFFDIVRRSTGCSAGCSIGRSTAKRGFLRDLGER